MGVGNDRSKGVYPEEDILIAATSFIKFKLKSDVVAKRTLKLAISQFFSV